MDTVRPWHSLRSRCCSSWWPGAHRLASSSWWELAVRRRRCSLTGALPTRVAGDTLDELGADARVPRRDLRHHRGRPRGRALPGGRWPGRPAGPLTAPARRRRRVARRRDHRRAQPRRDGGAVHPDRRADGRRPAGADAGSRAADDRADGERVVAAAPGLEPHEPPGVPGDRAHVPGVRAPHGAGHRGRDRGRHVGRRARSSRAASRSAAPRHRHRRSTGSAASRSARSSSCSPASR